MHFTTALLLGAAALTNAAVLPRQDDATHKIYIDTSACLTSAKTIPQLFGISTSAGVDYVDPYRVDGPYFTYTVPAYYKAHVWLYDSDTPSAQNTAVQGPDVFFFGPDSYVELLAIGEPNADGVIPKVNDQITAVRFAGTEPSSLYIEGADGGKLNTTGLPYEALYVTYC